MNLRWLKWLAIVFPLVFLAVFDYVRHFMFPIPLHTWPGYFVAIGIVLVVMALFANGIFGIVRKMEQDVLSQSAQLKALNEAGVSLTTELSLETVLQKVVDLSRSLVSAKYGALSVLKKDGEIGRFLVSGLSSQTQAAIGAPPQGRGLLGIILTEGETIRLEDITKDPRFFGFPSGHPIMKSLLGVPIVLKGQVVGNLYVTDKEGGTGFTHEDEEIIKMFATQAAVAIENARLYEEVESLAIVTERERIAREMHDNLAQVLAYVIIKAQAAKEFLRSGQASAVEGQLDRLEQVAKELYADVREAILGLRTEVPKGQNFSATLEEYVRQFGQRSRIETKFVADGYRFPDDLPSTVEIQLLRIIQEALTNVRKHSQAQKTWVKLNTIEDGIELVVQDNGRGFDSAQGARGEWPKFGLKTMRERAESVGGTFNVETSPGHGTKVIVQLPVRRNVTDSTQGEGGTAKDEDTFGR